MVYGLIFFFKQKTAYEMRISDWSSDVCSSDLAKAGQFAHRMLCRLGLQFARGRDVWHKRDVHRYRLVGFELVPELANRLHERQRFDIAHCAADLAQDEIMVILVRQREFLDRIGDRKSTRLNSSH